MQSSPYIMNLSVLLVHVHCMVQCLAQITFEWRKEWLLSVWDLDPCLLNLHLKAPPTDHLQFPLHYMGSLNCWYLLQKMSLSSSRGMLLGGWDSCLYSAFLSPGCSPHHLLTKSIRKNRALSGMMALLISPVYHDVLLTDPSLKSRSITGSSGTENMMQCELQYLGISNLCWWD